MEENNPVGRVPASMGGRDNSGWLSPEAELHYKRGVLHLRRAEAVMPYSMSIREEKTPPGADVVLALLSLASVATAQLLGRTGWIEEYQEELTLSLAELGKALAIAPGYADIHFRRAQALRHLGRSEEALEAVREAVQLAPNNREYASFLRVLNGGEARREAQVVEEMRKEAERPLSWDDIILPAKTKRELRQVQLMLENPSQARSLGIETPTGLLLYGPPGTGKTTVARVLAAQAKCRFFSTSPAEINSMWVGESEKAVARIFADARAGSPSIIFLDEVDALISNRTGGMHPYSDKVVNQFLQEMDGLTANSGVFVIGATNRPDMLDAALIRGGRLSRQIEIPLPDYDARLGLLKLHTRGAQIDVSVDLSLLAMQTEGFSGADLRALVNEAGLQALIRLADEGGVKALTTVDFELAVGNLRRSSG